MKNISEKLFDYLKNKIDINEAQAVLLDDSSGMRFVSANVYIEQFVIVSDDDFDTNFDFDSGSICYQLNKRGMYDMNIAGFPYLGDSVPHYIYDHHIRDLAECIKNFILKIDNSIESINIVISNFIQK